jgi:hypothetical protein
MVTQSWQRLFEEIEQMPKAYQDELAMLVAQEIKWERSFVQSQDALAKLAQEALGEHEKGETQNYQKV